MMKVKVRQYIIYILIDQYDLVEINSWYPFLKNKLISDNGSVQLLLINLYLRQLYKSVWEIKQREIVNMAAERGVYIDQSQSLNIHIEVPNYKKLTSLHFYSWKKGLKTGMYYLRTRPAAEAIKFTVSNEKNLPVQSKPDNPSSRTTEAS